jgi:hypothetical protein
LAAGRSRCGPPACNSCRDGGRTGATLKRVALSSFLRSFPKRERTNAANQRTGTADSKHKAPHSDGRAAPSPRILPINWGLLIPVIRLEGGKKSARCRGPPVARRTFLPTTRRLLRGRPSLVPRSQNLEDGGQQLLGGRARRDPTPAHRPGRRHPKRPAHRRQVRLPCPQPRQRASVPLVRAKCSILPPRCMFTHWCEFIQPCCGPKCDVGGTAPT